MPERNGNEKDAKRIGTWLAVVLGVLVVLGVVFNVFWYKRPPANAPDKPPVAQPAAGSEKPPGS